MPRKTSRRKAAAKPCPSCGARDAMPILYGFPTREAFEASKRGEVALGGCTIVPDMPYKKCRACGTEF